MKSFIVSLLLIFFSTAFGQKTMNLQFQISSSDGYLMKNTEIKFYSADVDTLLYSAVTDGKGYILWSNAPLTNIKAVYADSTYKYKPKTTYLYKGELTEKLYDIMIDKLSERDYQALMSAMEKSNSTSILEVIDDKGTFPEYKGGREAMVNFLQKTIQIPSSALEEAINGKVYLRFVIEADGTIKNLEVRKGLTPDTDFESLLVVAKMPKWIPATLEGKPVAIYFTLPISFRVQ